MKLAKPRFDVGLFTNQREEMLAFWGGEVGLPFEELLPTGAGVQQHRHGLNGSVFKLNHARDALPPEPPAGYRELLIAREGLSQPRALEDPDGNRVTLVPSGHRGIVGVGVELVARDERAARAFYVDALELEPCGERAYRCGDSVLLLAADAAAASDPPLRAPGYRYLTIQVHDCEAEHHRILERGGREGSAPVTLGDVARISFVRDPDGNWIEISQRASLTGPLG